MDRKRFRLKEGGGAAVLPIVRETGSGMAGGLGQKRFSLQKVSRVSGRLDAEKTIVHNSLSKVSNFSGDKDENQQPGGQEEDELYAATLAELERLHAARPKAPYLDDQDRLRIPCGCEPKYRWWQDGQSPFETALELGASDEELEHHVNEIFNPDDWRKWQEIKAARRAGAVSAKVSSSLANEYLTISASLAGLAVLAAFLLPQNKSTISRRAAAFANSSRDQQEAGLAIGEFTHYKKRFTLYICSTFKKGISRPKAQRSEQRQHKGADLSAFFEFLIS